MSAKALRRAIRVNSRRPNATRSSGEVLRKNTSPRRGENCGKIIVPEIQYILAGGSSRPETANVPAVLSRSHRRFLIIGYSALRSFF